MTPLERNLAVDLVARLAGEIVGEELPHGRSVAAAMMRVAVLLCNGDPKWRPAPLCDMGVAYREGKETGRNDKVRKAAIEAGRRA